MNTTFCICRCFIKSVSRWNNILLVQMVNPISIGFFMDILNISAVKLDQNFAKLIPKMTQCMESIPTCDVFMIPLRLPKNGVIH